VPVIIYNYVISMTWSVVEIKLLSARINLFTTVMMVKAIVSPSVLASNFGQLSAECTRMIKNGADWLHMGEPDNKPARISLIPSIPDVMDGYVNMALF